jgi:hypothetical protein
LRSAERVGRHHESRLEIDSTACECRIEDNLTSPLFLVALVIPQVLLGTPRRKSCGAGFYCLQQTREDCDSVRMDEIRNEREFYQAVRDYSSKVWQWGASMDDDFNSEMTPNELLELLEERIRWVKAHKRAVDRYLQKQGGMRWLRVIESSASDSHDRPSE